METLHPLSFNPPIVGKFYELYRLTHRWQMNFAKPQRYSLGTKLCSLLLDSLAEIYYLNALPNSLKANRLLLLAARNDTIKILWRLALDTKTINFYQYETAQSILQTTGKMIGGWIKFSKEHA